MPPKFSTRRELFLPAAAACSKSSIPNGCSGNSRKWHVTRIGCVARRFPLTSLRAGFIRDCRSCDFVSCFSGFRHQNVDPRLAPRAVFFRCCAAENVRATWFVLESGRSDGIGSFILGTIRATDGTQVVPFQDFVPVFEKMPGLKVVLEKSAIGAWATLRIEADAASVAELFDRNQVPDVQRRNESGDDVDFLT